MTPFRSLRIPETGDYWLRAARIPECLLSGAPPAAADSDGSLLVDLFIEGGNIAAVEPAGSAPAEGASVELGGRHVWPMLVDVHTHLDKGHVVDRTPNPDGSFAGARDATSSDRERFWRHDDVYRRMNFGLRCAEAHGVSAIRTHLDSHEGQGDISWEVFRNVREEWKGRIDLQAVGLFPIDIYRGPYGVHMADVVARSGGIIGGVTRASGQAHGENLADIDTLLDTVFRLAAERDLAVDLHVDETGDPSAATLRNVAEAVLRNRFRNPVTCGHCCSLAVQDEREVERTIGLVAEAGISIVTLPTVNMYLQDRVANRTPRWRGVTVVKELRAKGVRVAVAGDNCRDAFYAYGDHDMLDTFRQAVRILHLDHPHGDAPALVAPEPAAIMTNGHGMIAEGAPARLIVFNARSLNEIVSRPHSDRLLIREGRALVCEMPDYEELEFVRAAMDFPRTATEKEPAQVAAE